MRFAPITTFMRKCGSEHPGLIFEICNDGGRMVDFGTAAHGDYFSITDTYDPLSNRRAFYDTSHVLPAAMLENYVEKWPTPKPENFRYMLRSGMMGMLTVMKDTNAWTAEQHAAARQSLLCTKRTAAVDARRCSLPCFSRGRTACTGMGLSILTRHAAGAWFMPFADRHRTKSSIGLRCRGFARNANIVCIFRMEQRRMLPSAAASCSSMGSRSGCLLRSVQSWYLWMNCDDVR